MTAGRAIRASDRDRDIVIRLLGDEAAVGRLTFSELDERTERALTARTRGELAALVADLPVALDVDAPPRAGTSKQVPWCLACLLPLALGLLGGATGLPGPLATVLGLGAAAALCGLTARRGTSR